MSRDYRAKRLAKAEDIPYAEALRRLREASTVSWPEREVTQHERLEIAGYTGPGELDRKADEA